jgi:hypothetical protein
MLSQWGASILGIWILKLSALALPQTENELITLNNAAKTARAITFAHLWRLRHNTAGMRFTAANDGQGRALITHRPGASGLTAPAGR